MVNVQFKHIGNLKGPKGDRGEKGSTGTFASASAVTLPAGSQATVSMSGPQDARAVQFGIPRGPAGASSAPTDQAIAEHLLDDQTQSNAALDEAVARHILDQGSKITDAISEKYGPAASVVVPIEHWLTDGEIIPTVENGVGPTATRTILNRAIDGMNAGYLDTGVPHITRLPGGTFDVGVGSLLLKNGVGFWGAGENSTVLRGSTENQPTFARGESVPNPWGGQGELRYLYFRDFTVDGSHNPGPEYTPDHKGFRLGFTRDTVFLNVTVKGFLATGFGVDNGKDVYFQNCKALNNGRGMLNNPAADRIGAGSGFGIGVGPHSVTAYHLINCVAVGNGSNGFFFETLSAREDSLYQTMGVKMIGCYASANSTGVLDAGCIGMTVIGGTFVANALAGFRVGTTHTRQQGGRDGIFQGNLVSGNGVGIQLDGMAEAGYLITDNVIVKNGGAGVYIPTAVIGANTPWPGRGVIFRGNKVIRNESSGFLLRTIAGKIMNDLTLESNDIRDNGTLAGGEYGDGITLAGNFGKPRLINNRITGNRGRAIALRGAAFFTLSPRIRGNDLDGSYGGGMLIEHTVEDQTLIAGNIEQATATYINQIRRPIPAYWATSGWARSGVAAGAAAPGDAFLTDPDEGPVMETVVDTPGDGTGRVTIALTPDTYIDTVDVPVYAAIRFRGPEGAIGIVMYRLNNGGNIEAYRFICTGQWQELPLSVFTSAAAYNFRLGVGLHEPANGEKFWVGRAVIARTADRVPIFTGNDANATWTGTVNDSLSSLTVP